MKAARPQPVPSTLQFDPGQSEVETYIDAQLRLVGLAIDDVANELGPLYHSLARQFLSVRSRYFTNDGAAIFRLANNVQITIFLYKLSRGLFLAGRRLDADRVYSLLRIISSVDLYYEVELPELWACDHPIGSVIGRGRFAREATLFFAQNCNIGNNRGVYPRIGGNLHMFANSSLLGDTEVSGNVVLANGACAIDVGTLSDCVVFGRSPELVLKPLSADDFREISLFTV